MASDNLGVAVSMSGRGGGEWLRGECAVDGDRITFDTDAAATYRPMQDPDLALELANLRELQDVPAFVERRGMLWHGSPGVGVVVESWADWQREVAAVYGVIRLADMTRRASSGDGDALEELRTAHGDALTEEEREDDEAGWLLRFASMMVAHAMDERLQAIRLGLEAEVGWRWTDGEPGVWAFAPRPVDLLGHVYYELALALMNRVPMQSCDECGRMFRVTHHRQRFCDDRCAQRNRYRRWSERQKAKKGVS